MSNKKPTNPYAPYKGSSKQLNNNNEIAHTPSNTNRKKKKKVSVVKVFIAIIVVLGAVLAILLAVGSIGYMHVDNLITQGNAGNLNHETVEETPEEYKGDHINILLCGVDYTKVEEGAQRGDDEADGKTDVIVYVSFDVKNKKVSLLQLPRDSYIGEGLTNDGKITSLYSDGADQENRISNLASYINKTYNLPVDNYATVNMDAFIEIYRILFKNEGYIQFELPYPIDIKNPDGSLFLTLPAGLNPIDPDTIGYVLRYRDYPQADIARLEVQESFYSTLFSLIMDAPIHEIAMLATKILPYVNTDLDLPTIISLGISFIQVKQDDIVMFTSPGGPITLPSGLQGFGVNPTNMQILLEDHFELYDGMVGELTNLPTNFEYHNGQIPLDGSSYEGKTFNGQIIKPNTNQVEDTNDVVIN